MNTRVAVPGLLYFTHTGLLFSRMSRTGRDDERTTKQQKGHEILEEQKRMRLPSEQHSLNKKTYD